MASLDYTKVVYVWDKGDEELVFEDDSYQFNCAFSSEKDGFYFDYTMKYDPHTEIHYYLEIGRMALVLELEERGLKPIEHRTQRRETHIHG